VLENEEDLAKSRVGTPLYLSPEIVMMLPYSYKTDVWSMGVLLYEMLTFKRPFTGALKDLARRIVDGVYEPVAGMYSSAARNLVAALLQTDPQLRPSMLEIVDGELLTPCLQYVKEVLGLDEPEEPRRRRSIAARFRSNVRRWGAEDSEEVPATWIGADTVHLRKAVGDFPAPLAGQVVDEIFELEQDSCDDLGDGSGSTDVLEALEAAQNALRIAADNAGLLLDASAASDDSWGSVVGFHATDVPASRAKAWIQTLLDSRQVREQSCAKRFRKFDMNHDDFLDYAEIHELVIDLCSSLSVAAPPELVIRATFDSCDKNHDKQLSKEEFSSFFEALLEFSRQALQGP